MPEPTILDTTRGLLAQALKDGLRVKDISRMSRGHLEYEWIRKFARGEITDPGVQRLQMLHDLLVHLSKLPQWKPVPGTEASPGATP